MVRILSFLAVFMFTGVAYAATLPDPLKDAVVTTDKEASIVLAGGCFWGVEAIFEHMKGVKSAVSGYAGGAEESAHYDQVSTGSTGHAEAVKVTYDPSVITAGQILKVFFAVAHDPTQLNRQGPDRGTQYRSAIFYTTPEQQEIADTYIRQLEMKKIFDGKIVTSVNALKAFYPAEDYHQDYAERNPAQPYILMHDLPKLMAFKKEFPAFYVAQK